MKKLFVLVVACLLVVALPHAPGVYASEVLKVTRDHFEFRNAPRVDDETFIGTLRIDTPVEWTGNVSGSWFEVKAPNGQIGWVHQSGLSSPKTPVKQRQTPEPASSISRSPKPRSSAEVSKLRATIKDLEKAEGRAEAQLQEKERRIQELSEELEQLEEKLSDTGQMLEDQEQLRTLNERKVTEAENELLELQGTLKEKDEALLTAKVETTKLQNQLQALRAQRGSPFPPERIILGLSLLVNLLGIAIFWVMRKRSSAVMEVSPAMNAEPEPIRQERPEVERPSTGTPVGAVFEEDEEEVDAEAQSADLQSENEDRFKELDVVMAAPLSDEELAEDADTSDEVEIDLGDVLPAGTGVATAVASDLEPSKSEEAEAPAVQDSSVVVIEEPIERLDTLADETAPETTVKDEELSPEEEPADEVAPVPVEHPQPGPSEDFPEKIEEPIEQEEVEELFDEVETVEEVEEIIDVEESAELEEAEELVLEEEVENIGTIGEDDHPETPIEEIEVSGESFEKLPKSATQRIESEDEDESSFEEKEEISQEEALEENGNDMIIGAPGIIDEDDYDNEGPEFESSPEIELGGFESEETELEAEEMKILSGAEAVLEEPLRTEEPSFPEEVIEEEPSEAEELIEEAPKAEEPSFEPVEMYSEPKEFEVEEIVVLEEGETEGSKALYDQHEERDIEALDISSEVEELLELEDAESAGEQKTPPSFLEPSPFFIEPENEPEELIASEENSMKEAVEKKSVEEVYDIELLDSGSNKENVIHVLSKLSGLTASPKALVENTPCLIATGAGKNDAESFRLLMLKLGAKVRIVPQG